MLSERIVDRHVEQDAFCRVEVSEDVNNSWGGFVYDRFLMSTTSVGKEPPLSIDGWMFCCDRRSLCPNYMGSFGMTTTALFHEYGMQANK